LKDWDDARDGYDENEVEKHPSSFETESLFLAPNLGF
jgi:hypothetical protein